jgi:RimJ/RimL family protein N-acetyltransferase
MANILVLQKSTNKMIATEFLSIKDYPKFGDWLENQDEETRQLYFGVSGSQHIIQALMDRIIGNPDEHFFLIAKDSERWVGTIHIAVSGKVVEFGVIVDEEYRGQGVANQLMEEALVWARNRGYKELFMHCLGYNKPIQHLCQKHGLLPRSIMGDSEVNVQLNPPSWATVVSEVGIRQRNVYHAFLQKSQLLYQEMYG